MREFKLRALFEQTHENAPSSLIWICIQANESIDLLTQSHLTQKTDWMQFTGLKDCNGKEVYEGDILQYLNDDKYKFTIQWNNEIAAFEICKGLLSYKLGVLSELEVIGNIHQNIELLNS